MEGGERGRARQKRKSGVRVSKDLAKAGQGPDVKHMLSVSSDSWVPSIKSHKISSMAQQPCLLAKYNDPLLASKGSQTPTFSTSAVLTSSLTKGTNKSLLKKSCSAGDQRLQHAMGRQRWSGQCGTQSQQWDENATLGSPGRPCLEREAKPSGGLYKKKPAQGRSGQR